MNRFKQLKENIRMGIQEGTEVTIFAGGCFFALKQCLELKELIVSCRDI
jgi:hypothetical protein